MNQAPQAESHVGKFRLLCIASLAVALFAILAFSANPFGAFALAFDIPVSNEAEEEATIDQEEHETNSILQAQADSRTVYIARSANSKIYHYDSTCSRMKNPRSMSLDEALASGYRGCEKCVTSSSSGSGAGSSGASTAADSNATESTGQSDTVTYDPLPTGEGLMYRLYNPNSGEHFYTASADECDAVRHAGWTYEGIGWTAPATSNTPVYRLYNANGGEHHYTTDKDERDNLVYAGWKDEGIGWYSDDARAVPLYRQYNPNKFSCNHNYTTSKEENDWLVSLGWRCEGIAWYGME